MSRPKPVLDLTICRRALVLVLERQADRLAGGLAFEDAGQDLDPVRLATLGREAGLPRPSPVEPMLDIRLGQRNARRCPVDDAADRRPMALAPGGEAE